MPKVALIDFDGTICDFAYPEMGDPKEGVKEALQKIRDMGYEIQILSCRTNRELHKYPIDRQQQVREMERYLDEHEIPYDQVLNEYKPLAHVYIDDRGIGFRNNWDEVIKELEELEEL